VDCYPNLLPFELNDASIDEFMGAMAATGVTHVQVNHLQDLMHPEALSQPDNVYLWFANFGAPLDLFVNSDLNQGLYPLLYLDRNKRCLMKFVAAARRYGILPILYLCEPRFVPERFFARHPTLRGARVDNPIASRTPLYALCTDRPEVLEHYRQMMAAMLKLVPDLAGCVIFTSDSGAGFDYNPYTYAGANGAGFNQKIPLSSRVSGFLSTLLSAGRAVNPEFYVNLSSGFPPRERAAILAACPRGITGSVYGALSWTGGLEEQWAYHQARFSIARLDRTKARQWRLDDMRARLEASRVHGEDPRVHISVPTHDYIDPIRYAPHPFECARLLKDYAAMGVRRLALWGVITSPQLLPHDINREVVKALLQDIDRDGDELIREFAGRWVGRPHADALVEAWRLSDTAMTRRPLWNHFFGWDKQLMPGPLVPDLTRLTPDQRSYYHGIGHQDLDRIQGLGCFLPHEPDERNRDHVLEHGYRRGSLTQLTQAVSLLRDQAATAAAEVRTVLLGQAEHIEFSLLWQRSACNWFEAGRYLLPGREPRFERSLTQIIDDEIDLSLRMHALIDGRADRFIKLFWSDHMMYQHGPGFPQNLLRRVEVMRAHRDDPVRAMNDHAARVIQYLKDLAETEMAVQAGKE
jgi:hypothetical protein